MDLLTITVANSNDPECVRMTVIKHHDIPITGNAKTFVRRAIEDAEQELRDNFPRGMTYTVPCTTVEFTPREVLAIREGERASAMEAVMGR